MGTAEGSSASRWTLVSGRVNGQKGKEDVRERFVYVNQFIARRPLGGKASASAPPSSAQRSSSTKVRIYKQAKRQERKMTMIIWKLETAAGLHSIHGIISQRELLSRFSPNCPMVVISTSFWYVQRTGDSAVRVSEMHSNYTQNNLNYERGMQFNLYLS